MFKIYVLTYGALIMCLLFLAIFFIGYLPEIEYRQRNYRSPIAQNLTKGTLTVSRVVLLVVDALSADMVLGRSDLWPLLGRKGSTCVTTSASLQPPSLSYARIKSLVTGSVSSYRSVLYNTEAGRLEQDNVLAILGRYRGLRAVHLGDVIWKRLFPPSKSRDKYGFLWSAAASRDGSFFVRDLESSDIAISRGLDKALSKTNEWEVLVLHYLGLDHMGHTLRSHNHPLVEAKVAEMAGQLNHVLKNLPGPVLVILTADHGMNTQGGHGGASALELSVPAIFCHPLLRPPALFQPRPDQISQTDIATALSLLFQVPIPLDSVGVFPPALLPLVPNSRLRTRLLLTNLRHLHSLLSPHTRFSLVPAKQDLHIIEQARAIQLQLLTQYIQHDLVLIDIAATCLLISLFMSLAYFCCCSSSQLPNPIAPTSAIPLFCLLSLLTSISIFSSRYASLYFVFKTALMCLFIVFTSHSLPQLIKCFIDTFNLFKSQKASTNLVTMVTLLLPSASFMTWPALVQEQHRVYQFVFVTVFLIFFLSSLATFSDWSLDGVLNSDWLAWCTCLCAHRLASCVNTTGELWTSQPDLAGFLMRSENEALMLGAVVIAFAAFSIVVWTTTTYSTLTRITIQIFIVVCLTQRFLELQRLQAIANGFVWTGYSLVVVLCVIGGTGWSHCTSVVTLDCSLQGCEETRRQLAWSTILLFVNAVNCRPVNLLVWAAVLIISARLPRHALSCSLPSTTARFLFFRTLGMSTFFLLGNSNSIASIDVWPGFAGLDSYIPSLVNPMVALTTVSGHFYWLLVWLEDERHEDHGPGATKARVSDSRELVHSAVLVDGLVDAAALVGCLLHRSVLASWAVYAPGLLYLGFHNGAVLVLAVLVTLITAPRARLVTVPL